jgi:hypothetical protein
MASTAQSLIQTSMELLGVYASGENMTAADSSRGLQVLNAMLDSWSNESLFCYAIQETSFPLVVGQAQYTIGPGGQINAVRPLRIIDGPGAAYIQDTNQNNYPVEVIPRDRWNMIGLRTNTSDIPDTLFYDPQYPLGIINIFPVPLISYLCFFDAYLQFSDFSALTSPMSLPPGYELAIYTNLAIMLKPFFKDAQIDPLIIEMASVSKATIKRNNIRSNTAVYDPEMVSRAAPTYNIYRDATGGS